MVRFVTPRAHGRACDPVPAILSSRETLGRSPQRTPSGLMTKVRPRVTCSPGKVAQSPSRLVVRQVLGGVTLGWIGTVVWGGWCQHSCQHSWLTVVSFSRYAIGPLVSVVVDRFPCSTQNSSPGYPYTSDVCLTTNGKGLRACTCCTSVPPNVRDGLKTRY